jgi:hypothetical protein
MFETTSLSVLLVMVAATGNVDVDSVNNEVNKLSVVVSAVELPLRQMRLKGEANE